MFSGLGVPELIIILIVVLIIFGPKNLPKLGETIGKTVKNFRNESEKGDADTHATEKAPEATAAAPAPAASASAAPAPDSAKNTDAPVAPAPADSTNKEEK